MMALTQWLLICVFGLCGVLLLKTAWSKSNPQKPLLIITSWVIFIGILVAAAYFWGSAKGVAIAINVVSMIALLIITLSLQIKNSKKREPREVALEPSDRKRIAWRGWLRAFIAGPLAGATAIGVGIAIAILSNGAPQTRMVIGGILIPVLWAGGMAWTLSDNKIIRATFVLLGIAIISYSAAFIKGSI